MQILIVEDVAAVGRATARLLRRYGYSVATVGSCLEGSALCDRFICGVFDIDLPDGSGIDLATRMLADGRVRAAIFFSGCADPAMVQRARELGDFVPKGDGVGELVRRVAQLVNASEEPPRARRRVRQRSGIRHRSDVALPPRASGGDE